MKILGIITVVLLPMAFGGFLAAPFHRFRGLSGWLAAGSVVGLTLFTWFGFLISIGHSIRWSGIIFSLLALALLTIGVRWRCSVRHILKERDDKEEVIFHNGLGEKIFSVCVLLFFVWLFWRVTREVILLKPDGLYIGFRNNFGDLPLHLHFTTSFLYSQDIPPQNPIFSGTPLRYPFLSDFYSTLLWFATGEMEWAMELPGLILGISFVVLFYQWVLRLTTSRLAASLAPLIFLLNGGTSWWLWIRDLSGNSQDWLPRTYTLIAKEGYHWANVIHALWVPQRALQFAFPLVILILAIALEAARKKDANRFLFAGLMAGLVPFFHGHSIIALSIMGGFLILRYPSKKWLFLILPLVLLWLPQVLYLSQVIGPKVEGMRGFTRLDVGWESDGWKIPWFWLKNTGFFIPVAVLGFSVLRKSKDSRWFAYGGFAIFAIGNLILFAPWPWDNIKVLIYWYLFTTPFVALSLAWIWNHRWIGVRVVMPLVLVTLILAGFLDVLHALQKEDHRILLDREIRFAEVIREKTPWDAVFLCAPTYNQPLVLTGRAMVMGYDGHVWSHGLPAGKRRNQIKKITVGGEEALQMLRDFKVTHVLYSSKEQKRELQFSRKFLDREVGFFHAAHRHILYQVKE